MIITGIHMVKYGYAERLHTALRGLGFEAKIFSRVNPDPDMDCVRAGVAACESFQPDIMFALGGGNFQCLLLPMNVLSIVHFLTYVCVFF